LKSSTAICYNINKLTYDLITYLLLNRLPLSMQHHDLTTRPVPTKSEDISSATRNTVLCDFSKRSAALTYLLIIMVYCM